MVVKSRPGPLGSSCLTCKRRHKKCDLRRPICKRCEVGRYTCEGYEHNRRGAARNTQPEVPHLPRVLEESSSYSTPSGSEWEQSIPESAPLPGELSEDTTISSSPDSFTSPYLNTRKGASGLPDDSHMSALVTKKTSRAEDYLRLFATRSTPDAPVTPLSMLRKIINSQAQLPYSLVDPMKTFLNSSWIVDYILEKSDKYLEQWYFRPVNYPRKRSQEAVVMRLNTSPITRWLSLVAMSIFEAFSTGDTSQDRIHITWIGYIEGCLMRELARELAPRQTQDRHSDSLHVAIMKTKIIHSSSTYQILRNMTPTFLQVAYSEPKIWPNGCDPAYIPLSNILGSESHELAYFALIDCTYSMASGLPQQVEYDTTVYEHPIVPSGRPSSDASHQWAHSSPSEFQLVLADINACRDKSPAARDWRDIEEWLVTWQSRPTNFEFTQPWMKIAWYAVQESWRLALLTYLYIAVCGISSDDPRIQSYIKQILQVVGTVKKQGSSDANMSFFVQYLMVGICARNEAHRKIARDKLCASNETKLWLLRASDFVPVLDHLWHGAAADGRPIKWSDYMHSREVAITVIVRTTLYSLSLNHVRILFIDSSPANCVTLWCYITRTPAHAQ
ncbi:hypothetical protein OPQ81_000350 [Rhizoctonia solani]|nr:hypothetical protein OPQ81_000350 [Rhizoctonia solani]